MHEIPMSEVNPEFALSWLRGDKRWLKRFLSSTAR